MILLAIQALVQFGYKQTVAGVQGQHTLYLR
jgi:hypothetical protein